MASQTAGFQIIPGGSSPWSSESRAKFELHEGGKGRKKPLAKHRIFFFEPSPVAVNLCDVFGVQVTR
jgi:hypothetical protein